MTVYGALLSVLAALLAWYLVLSLAIRNQDGPAIAWAVGALTLAAGICWDIGI